MKRDFAETVGLRALAWVAGNEDLLPVFLGSTGTSVEEMRSRAPEAEFLGAVLDFLTMDDRWLCAFCDDAGLDYGLPLQARQSLPGGAAPDWT